MQGAVIRLATDEDIPILKAWLSEELQQTGEGFYVNWHIICTAHNNGFLTVLAVGDEPVALLAEEESGPLILEVRPNERRKGYGRGLAEHMIKSWYDRGESVLDIDCAPTSSFGFWRRLGFQRIGEGTDEWARQAYLIFKRHHDLGSGPRVPYEISFYPTKWGLNRETAPFRLYRGHGERMENGSIKLPERAVLYYPFPRDQSGRIVDCVVHVRVGDHDIFDDKVKREHAAAIGVEQDIWAYYIDNILIANPAG